MSFLSAVECNLIIELNKGMCRFPLSNDVCFKLLDDTES